MKIPPIIDAQASAITILPRAEPNILFIVTFHFRSDPLSQNWVPALTLWRSRSFSLYLRLRLCLRFCLCLPAALMAEQCVGILLLSVRHAGVERLEDRDEILEAIRMGIGNFAIGFEVVDSVPGHCVFRPCLDERFHPNRIVPHGLGDVIPQTFLCRGNLDLGPKLFDAYLDTFGLRGLTSGRHAWLGRSGDRGARACENDKGEEHHRRDRE